MFTALALTLATTLSTQLGTVPEVLPNSPQGRHVSAYIEAFNAGESTFVSMYDVETIPKMAADITPAERAQLYKRLVREVGTIKVDRLVASSAKTITFSMRVRGKGSTATFTFTFEEKAPFRIASVDVEVSER